MNTTTPASPLHRAYSLLVLCASKLQSPLLLVIRLYWGWQFCQTGWGKLTSHGKVTEYFMSLNIPLPGLNAWMVGLTESCGGLLLILGLASRLAALPLIATMIVAYLTAENEALQFVFSNPGKFTGSDPFPFLFACLVVLAFGPGVFSLDYLLGRRFG